MVYNPDAVYYKVKPMGLKAEAKSWEGSKIDVKASGRWLLFYDRDTKTPLNNPPEEKKPIKIKYRHRTPSPTPRVQPPPKPQETLHYSTRPPRINAYRFQPPVVQEQPIVPYVPVDTRLLDRKSVV